MAITVKIEEDQSVDMTFPCILKDVRSELVVLFTGNEEGFVVHPGQGYSVGDHSDCWEYAWDENEWEPSPPIALSNA